MGRFSGMASRRSSVVRTLGRGRLLEWVGTEMEVEGEVVEAEVVVRGGLCAGAVGE